MKILIGIIVIFSALVLAMSALTHKPPAPVIISVVPTATLTPTPTPTIIITKIPTPLPPTPTPTPATDINSTVNSYRMANDRSALQTNGDLCRIATTRAAQQAQAGSLDNHAGFQGEAASQKEFLHVGEILQYHDPPESNHYLVYTGWAQSGEHNAVLLDPGWTHGCGATNGSFAVFIFGRK
jgi:uncharacterized protein YkwD